RGELVGVVLVVADDDGLALVAPAGELLAAAHQLAEGGEVRRAWLGVQATDLDVAIATNVGVAGGAAITSVQDRAPAASAGLAPGDAVVAVGDVAIHDASDLEMAIRSLRPGE